MHEINETQIVELEGVGKTLGKAAKSVGKGVADFGKGFKAGYTDNKGKTTKKGSQQQKKTPAKSTNIVRLQKAMSGMNARQLQAIQKQLAKKTGATK